MNFKFSLLGEISRHKENQSSFAFECLGGGMIKLGLEGGRDDSLEFLPAFYCKCFSNIQ